LLVQLVGVLVITSVDPTDPSAQSKLNKGKTIALIGIGVQLACFGFFSIIAVRFHFVSKLFAADFEARVGVPMDEKYYTVDGEERKLKKTWRTLLLIINLACVMILVRCHSAI
jgi:RTA1 like protein